MIKFKCPSSKRRLVLNILEYKDHTVVITPERVHHTRYDYVGPHAYWDFLYENATGEWLPVCSQQLAYAVAGRPWGVSAALLANKADAVKFMLQFGGIMLSEFADDYLHELAVTRSLSSILSLSREDRRQAFPGLDDLVSPVAVDEPVRSGAHV